jgi:hypothetical protein
MRMFMMVVALTILPLIGVGFADERKDKRNLKHIVDSFFETTVTKTTLEKRRKGAAEIFSLCQSLNKKIPVLSPSETKWLDNEIKNERFDGLSGAIEVSKRSLKNNLRECVTYSRMLQNESIGQIEPRAWIVLSKVFLSPNEDSLDLVKRKLNLDISGIETTLLSRQWIQILVGGMLHNALAAMNEVHPKSPK